MGALAQYCVCPKQKEFNREGEFKCFTPANPRKYTKNEGKYTIAASAVLGADSFGQLFASPQNEFRAKN